MDSKSAGGHLVRRGGVRSTTSDLARAIDDFVGVARPRRVWQISEPSESKHERQDNPLIRGLDHGSETATARGVSD